MTLELFAWPRWIFSASMDKFFLYLIMCFYIKSYYRHKIKPVLFLIREAKQVLKSHIYALSLLSTLCFPATFWCNFYDLSDNQH